LLLVRLCSYFGIGSCAVEKQQPRLERQGSRRNRKRPENAGIVWSVDPADWAAKACNIAHRHLTRAEWAEFLGHREYHHVCP
jgi:hypothetical protein